ncbi:metal-dependent hydrolase [Arthrobacter castelli]|uniref:metal-dependent hydrolase n=1 Tax=Arthrobacter castelli TaxID=271431 RepID=UPI0004192EFF|nr:metal-dependent hydrolase [Arthrobacter castelli]
MTLPLEPTTVTYPAGAVHGTAVVVHLAPQGDGSTAVLLDSTPCHPVDAAWPDQGPDRAVIRKDGSPTRVSDCVTAATDGTQLYTGEQIPAKKGAEGWTFAVAHLVDDDGGLAEGDEVQVEVDEDYRAAISAGHTACHVASLALNQAMAHRWKKDARADGRGEPDFDGLAIDVSTIVPNGSVDTYRMGKSLRRKGFITDGVPDELAELEGAINGALASWIGSGAAVRIEREGSALTDVRYWVCELPDHTVRIPCGGTHLDSLEEVSSVRVALSIEDASGTPVLRMETTAAPA